MLYTRNVFLAQGFENSETHSSRYDCSARWVDRFERRRQRTRVDFSASERDLWWHQARISAPLKEPQSANCVLGVLVAAAIPR
jgi:hypothetical protein